MNKNVSLRQLRAFQAVAQYNSFTGAAHHLHLTQSALSVLVREMETELGVKLFDRTTRKTTLTEAGRQLQPSIARLLEDLSMAISDLDDLRDKRRGVLRVAAPQLMACTVLPQLLAGWQALYPDIRVRISDTLPEYLLDTLHSHVAEVAIGPDQPMSRREPENGSTVQQRALSRSPHLLVCTADHPLTRVKRVTWHALLNYPFIAPTRDFAERVLPHITGANAACVRDMLTTPAYEVSYISTAIGMVSKGLGLTVCPAYAAQIVQAYGLVMIKLAEPLLYRDVCLYTLAQKTLSPAAQAFVAYVRSTAMKDKAFL